MVVLGGGYTIVTIGEPQELELEVGSEELEVGSEDGPN